MIPNWMTEEGLVTLKKQHLLPGESPDEMYNRVVNTLVKHLPTELQESKQEAWLKYVRAGWLGLATPIAANTGTNRGLPISCFVSRIPDTLSGIYKGIHEMAILSKYGGGVGLSWDKVRGRGTAIGSGGFSTGVIPFMKVYDAGIQGANQGNIRRGAASVNLPIRHPDYIDFLNMRKPEGDANLKCMNLNHCVTIDDYFMQDVIDGDPKARDLWAQTLSTRKTTGQPYIMYYHNVNNNRNEYYKKTNQKIDGTNICCLSGDTEVVTKEGIYQIQDLVNKTVTIFDGNNWVSCDNFKEYSEDDIYEITLKNGQKLKANGNHRWFAATNYNDIRSNKYRELTTTELKEGLWLEDSMLNAEYHGNETMSAAYLKGFLLADGTHTDSRPLLNVHFTKYQCISKLIESCLEIESQDVNTTAIVDVSFSDEVVNPSQYGAQRFKRMKGLTPRKHELINYATTYKQQLPDLRNLTKESKLQFLSGLLDGDGCYSTAGIQISSIHLQFIEQLQKLIFSLGFNSSIDIINQDNRTSIYRLSIGNYDSYQLIQKLDCMRLEQPEVEPNRRTTGYRQIVSITKLNDKEKVYCPQVPTTKKFLLANGIMTGNTEILLPHHFDSTVVCCVSSLNIAKFDEWKDEPEFIEDCLLFLDCVITEFIDKAQHIEGFEHSVKFAREHRALGLGVLGFHTYLQSKGVPFTSIAAKSYIRIITKKMKEAGQNYQNKYKDLPGTPEQFKEFGIRNTTLFAIAPTTSNSLITGGVSQGIEPVVGNMFTQQSAKGAFIRKNRELEKVLEKHYPEYNTDEVWKNIEMNNGSVQHLAWLSDDIKEVFLTAFEINQLGLIENAALWYDAIDQGISLNLFFPAVVNPKWFNECHIKAWELGIKTLYYVRTESIAASAMTNTFSTCVNCEG